MRRCLALTKMLAILLFAVGIAACAPTAREMFGPQLDHARSQGSPLVIYAYGVPGPIAVGKRGAAVPVYVQFVVTSPQPLRHVQFLLVGHSTRGIPVRAPNGKIRAVVLNGPGPFSPGGNYEINSFRVRPAGFPGGDVACVELARVKLRYADGQKRVYDVRALQSLLLPPLRRQCPDQGPTVYMKSGGY